MKLSMNKITCGLGALAILAAAGLASAQDAPMKSDEPMKNGAMSSDHMNMSSDHMKMSRSQMRMMKKCMAMGHDKMMANAKCEAMADKHPDMMKK